MKLIDADALKAEILKAPVWTGLDAIAKINTMPSIDITRCKECRLWNTDRATQDKAYCEMHSGYTKDDNYCAWAERSIDE